MRRLAALVLAAGRGSRFGGPKQIALLDGRPLLVHVIEAILAARPGLRTAGVALDEVVVVLGFRSDEVERAIEGAIDGAVGEAVEGSATGLVRIVRNPDPARGIASSLQAGLGALGPDVEGALVALGDQPRLAPSPLVALARAWEGGGGSSSNAPRDAGMAQVTSPWRPGTASRRAQSRASQPRGWSGSQLT